VIAARKAGLESCTSALLAGLWALWQRLTGSPLLETGLI
jgi:hypothetical protein